MMSSNPLLCKSLESFLNESRGDDIQEFYGRDTKILIRSMTFSPVKKHCLIDSIVVLGDLKKGIDLDPDPAEVFILDVSKYFLGDYRVMVMVGFDI
jgi:hypothetical protein